MVRINSRLCYQFIQTSYTYTSDKWGYPLVCGLAISNVDNSGVHHVCGHPLDVNASVHCCFGCRDIRGNGNC